MAMPTDNIEAMAREICARDFERGGKHAPDAIPALVERFWPVVAALIDAGLVDDDGTIRTGEFDAGQTAWEDWLDRRRQ